MKASPSRRRGPHPQDERLFAPKHHPALRDAVADLSWLRSRGYAETSSLKIVGDRYRLTARQRSAVGRSACSEEARAEREQREVEGGAVEGIRLLIDGFNVLTTIEAALAGGVLLRGRDGCIRDLSSMHGNYRVLADTEAALRLLLATVASLRPAESIWYLDAPVSNSGQLGVLIGELAESVPAAAAKVRLVRDPDAVLKRAPKSAIIATADSGILDSCGPWINLVAPTLDRIEPRPRVLDLSLET